MIDVDHFKAINDSRGHGAGDTVLRIIASSIAAVLRPYDSVGRCGGEEFLIVAPGCGMAETWELAERVRSHVAGCNIMVDGSSVQVSLSLGVATGETAVGIEKLLHVRGHGAVPGQECRTQSRRTLHRPPRHRNCLHSWHTKKRLLDLGAGHSLLFLSFLAKRGICFVPDSIAAARDQQIPRRFAARNDNWAEQGVLSSCLIESLAPIPPPQGRNYGNVPASFSGDRHFRSRLHRPGRMRQQQRNESVSPREF